MKPIGLYIHIPWCIQKCPYCDFNSHALKTDLPEQTYVDILLQDLQQDLQLLENPAIIGSIFIGGGTPSLFSALQIERLLKGIKRQVVCEDHLEITMEANPGTFESKKFNEYRALGINRLSIGIQSFNNQHLKKLGRIHSAEEAITAVETAKKAGFDNFNLDLMFGLPDQTIEQMLLDVRTAIRLQPTHISFYQLTLEPNTFFYKHPPVLPEDDKIFSGQIRSQRCLADAGYQQYEISAYAKNKAMSQHNLNYWKFGDYLGIGAGAHGKLTHTKKKTLIRTTKRKSPQQYLQNPSALISEIKQGQIPLEYMMNQLRLKQGFTAEHYQQNTSLGLHTLQPALSEAIAVGLIEKQTEQYRCTEKGWNFLDDILEKFIN